MRVIIQRVSEASVLIDKNELRSISHGLMVLAGFEEADTTDDVAWTAAKTLQLRIFADEEGKMNRSVQETAGQIMVISQFTLHAMTKKGNRPSFIRAAKPETAIPLYELYLAELKQSGITVVSGSFGAHMDVQLINDGPVTIYIDSKNRE